MTRRPRVVVALGGNALLQRGEPMTIDAQRRNIAAAVDALAPLAVAHDLVITHGNGPQVGLLALRDEAYEDAPADPLDVLDAETEAMIGYVLEQALVNALPGRETATLLTQVIVDIDDPAFGRPTKPIGPGYERARAERVAAVRGWHIALDGALWRRVVASPEPREIVELTVIRGLVDAGVVLVCAGGGGIPVVRGDDGLLHGVEAVVDKDLCSALLAQQLGADALLLLTDVPCVERDWGTAAAAPIRHATPEELDPERFAAGSMRPKLEAARRFAATGGVAGIGALGDAAAILAGEAGTRVALATHAP